MKIIKTGGEKILGQKTEVKNSGQKTDAKNWTSRKNFRPGNWQRKFPEKFFNFFKIV